MKEYTDGDTTGRKKLKKMRLSMVLWGSPVTVFQWFSIIYWIKNGVWWPFAVWVPVSVLFGITVSKYYFKRVKYICPECHNVFKPSIKEAFWAFHTPSRRKLTCPECNHKKFCTEIWDDNTN